MKKLFLFKVGGNLWFPILHAFIEITEIKPLQFNMKTLLKYKTLGINLIFSITYLAKASMWSEGRGGGGTDGMIYNEHFFFYTEYFINLKTGKKELANCQRPDRRFILCNIPKDRTLHHLYMNDLKQNVDI